MIYFFLNELKNIIGGVKMIISPSSIIGIYMEIHMKIVDYLMHNGPDLMVKFLVILFNSRILFKPLME